MYLLVARILETCGLLPSEWKKFSKQQYLTSMNLSSIIMYESNKGIIANNLVTSNNVRNKKQL